jgi:hypothetical protein
LLKIDHHHVILLAIPVAPANPLLDALRVPRKIVVDYQGTELEINSLRSCFGSNQDGSLFAKAIH